MPRFKSCVCPRQREASTIWQNMEKLNVIKFTLTIYNQKIESKLGIFLKKTLTHYIHYKICKHAKLFLTLIIRTRCCIVCPSKLLSKSCACVRISGINNIIFQQSLQLQMNSQIVVVTWTMSLGRHPPQYFGFMDAPSL